MKQWIHEHHPELLDIGACNDSYKALYNAIEEAWWVVPQDFIDDLVRSMVKRVKAILKAGGWQSKY